MHKWSGDFTTEFWFVSRRLIYVRVCVSGCVFGYVVCYNTIRGFFFNYYISARRLAHAVVVFHSNGIWLFCHGVYYSIRERESAYATSWKVGYVASTYILDYIGRYDKREGSAFFIISRSWRWQVNQFYAIAGLVGVMRSWVWIMWRSMSRQSRRFVAQYELVDIDFWYIYILLYI